MNTLEEKKFKSWTNLNTGEKNSLQQICRDSIIEPFEGRKGLETIQKTRTGIEKGLGKLKNISKSTSDKIRDYRWVGTSKSKMSDLMTYVKKKSKSTQSPGIIPKFNFFTEKLPQSSKLKIEKLEKKTVRFNIGLTKSHQKWIPKFKYQGQRSSPDLYKKRLGTFTF
jgi:hypothetical protein